MRTELTAADVGRYLDAAGWTRQPERWRQASVWVYAGEHEVIVPDDDRFADGPRRLREIVGLLARLEGRPPELVAADIGTPLADLQWYRAPAVALDGRIGLVETVTALTGAQEVLTAAARAAHAGPRAVAEGPAPAEVRAMLHGIRVGPIIESAETVLVRVPLGGPGDPPLGRRALELLQRTLPLLSEATRTALRDNDYEIFDGLVAEGVSADLCGALARLSGPGAGSGFEIGVRWARAAPAAVPGGAVEFAAGSGQVLRRVRHRLRRLRLRSGSVTGLVRVLSDDLGGNRFRVKVRGLMTVEGTAAHRSVWVRLPDEAAYDMAISAHRDGRAVVAEGTLRDVNGGHELVADRFGPTDEES
ncbi:hypothetical protein [Actinomadura macrotermitis]|uniref:Uncharacterized protein n=1 Tax=Actinomadura macrotermitis TaxID=2585200 RepID=A0A7K0BRA1_9ACTN|nr:hypothetical protein [Actinomadura macrotermitis]